MVGMDKDIRKRWLRFALINFALVVLIFGALVAGFAVYAVTAQQRILKNSVRDYADELRALGIDEIESMCREGTEAGWREDPAMIVALYTVRDNGSVSLTSRSETIVYYNPALGGKTEVFRSEEIGGYEYLTYTVRVGETGQNYLKIFVPYNAAKAAESEIGTVAIPFSVAFVIVAGAFSLIWGYLAIKPIATGYVKQKNFINDMSHEIRTPLAVIKGNLENALADPSKSVADVEEMIEGSLREVDYMNDISAGLLNIVRVQSGAAARKDSDLSEVLSEVVDMFADLAAVGNKALVANLEYCDIKVDREKVKQFASAIIENAIKYTDEGDRIDIKLRNTRDGCVFTVSDTGIGVPKGDLERIFDRFYRGENAKETPGTGLGLAIASATVEGMGGTIRAVNRTPRGLEVIVTLVRQ